MTIAWEDDRQLQLIEQWEEQFFITPKSDTIDLYYESCEKMLERVEGAKKQQFLYKMDRLLFELQAATQQSKTYHLTNERIIHAARIFDEELTDVEELRALSLTEADFLAEQFMAKQRLLSLGQGGVTGLGGIFLLAIDMPALAYIQVSSLQQLASIYGYDLRREEERFYLLKLFQIAIMPQRYKRDGWERLFNEIEAGGVNGEAVFQEQSLDILLRQIAKGFAITMLRKKLVQGVPLFGMIAGASLNYRSTQQVIEIGQYFYKKRRVLEQSV